MRAHFAVEQGAPEHCVSGDLLAVLQVVLKRYAFPHGVLHVEVAVVYYLGVLHLSEHQHHRRKSHLLIECNCCMVFLDCTGPFVFDTRCMNYSVRVSSEQNEQQ
jgi:hypothetical protein